MKIYFIGQKGIPAISGGIERHVEELAVRMAEKGHDVFVYTRAHYTPANKKEYKGVNLISLPSIKSKHLDAITHTLLASLDVLRRDADIIHYHGIGPASLLWIPKLIKRKAKIFFTFHCRDYFHQKWGIWARIYLGIGEIIGVTGADQVIAVSKTIKQYVKDKYNLSCLYLPNGCQDLKKVKSTAALTKFKLDSDGYLLNVSRLIPHKGIHTLIEAYQKINTNKKLVIVGEPAYTDDYFAALKKFAKGNPKIVFTGLQTGKALAELYSHAYAVIQPSQAEGLSIALLEALAYGKPVISSDIPENVEVVTNQMLTFKNKNVRSLARKLQIIVDNPNLAKSLSRRTKKIIAPYRWSVISDGLEFLYRAMLLKDSTREVLDKVLVTRYK